MGNEFSVQTLKVKSKMASSRMKAHIQKKENAMTKQRREIAKLLVDEKEQSARIKVEGIIREENLCRIMEWLEMMCDLIHQRVKQIQISKECPEDLTECICTILYCAKRMDIPELTEMGRQFAGKWGQTWLEENIENRSGRVSKQIIEKLSPEPPTRETVVKKLKAIAEEFDVSWKPGTLEQDESMPAIIGHRNEYTVEFDSKPFGMEWTATEDGKNLWVSSIDPKSESAKKGVVPGSLLMALNGIDIKDLGAKVIHQKASSCGLPLRISFRKPEGMNAPTYSKDMSVNTDIVNKCVTLLKDPSNWEMSDSQREAMCKKQGANPAEVASALFLAKYMIENMSQQPAPEYQVMPSMGYPGPSNNDFPHQAYSQQPPQAYSQPPMDGNMTYGPGSPMDHMNMHESENPPISNTELDLPDVPSSSKPNNMGDLDVDDLEARFANLKKGL